MIPTSHWQVLRKLCAHLEPEGVVWALTGSTSLALQGVPVPVHDIDVQTDAEGAYAVQRCFSSYIAREVAHSATDTIRSHFGALTIDGVQVEIMGDIEKRLPGGEWEAPPPIALLRTYIEADGLRVPVLPLEYECEAYLKLGRPEKAQVIRETLERRANRSAGPA